MHRRDFMKVTATAAATASRGKAAVPPSSELWSTPASAPLPEWAKTGNFVFMGLDGGPLEAEKGLRSGWAGFTRGDPQGIVKAVREFYRPENVDIPRTAGANWVFVTWTNGWSKDRERRDQWPHAMRFIDECRKNGIHVSAYVSCANMFWEDYLERVPESRKWIETKNPAFIRHYGGSLYRVMANVKLPEWRQEIKTAIDTALDAGVEGFWMDNLFWWHGLSLFVDFNKEMLAYARRRRPDVLWHTNVNAGIYNWARVGNVVGTEDGRGAGLIPDLNPPVSGNLGLLSFISGLRDGWRSAILEHYGNDLSGATRQLMVAECWMWQVGKTWFPTDRALQLRCHQREPAGWKVLEAMGAYNRHQLKYAEFFRGGQPLANIGIVGHPGSFGEDIETQTRTMRGQSELIALLNLLAGWNVQYEVLFENQLQPEVLRKFAVVVVADPEHVPDGAPEALDAYALGGGALLAPEGTGILSGAGKRLSLPRQAFQAKGSPEKLKEQLAMLDSNPSIVADAPQPIVYRALRQQQRLIVHLVNYKLESARPFTLRYRGAVSRAEVLTPETGGPKSLAVQREGPWSAVTIPEFPVHSLVAFYDRR